MPFDPEAIEAALFETIRAAVEPLALFNKISRRGRIYGDVDIGSQPSLALIPRGFTTTQANVGVDAANPALVPRYTFEYQAWMYFRASAEPDTIPQQDMAPAIKAVIESLYSKPPGEQQTLGGLVEHCWTEGVAYVDPGLEDEQLWCGISIKAITGV